MGNDENENPFRCRCTVVWIAVLDILLSVFLLGFYLVRFALYEGKYGDMTTGLLFKYGFITDPVPFYYFIDEMQKFYVFIWIAIFLVYTIQLIMAIILLFGACQSGVEDARRRCKIWCSSIAFNKAMIGIDLFILAQTFAKHGDFNYFALGMWATKFIFRLLSERIVRIYVKDLSRVHYYSRGYPIY